MATDLGALIRITNVAVLFSSQLIRFNVVRAGARTQQ
jgi:hypothetical protein